jgi:protein TonB
MQKAANRKLNILTMVIWGTSVTIHAAVGTVFVFIPLFTKPVNTDIQVAESIRVINIPISSLMQKKAEAPEKKEIEESEIPEQQAEEEEEHCCEDLDETPVDKVDMPSTAISPPGYSENFPPVYPRIARRMGYEGKVILIATISEAGVLIEVIVKDSSGHPVLDKAAVNAVRKWKFTPAIRDGLPVEGTLEIPIRFKLKSD